MRTTDRSADSIWDVAGFAQIWFQRIIPFCARVEIKTTEKT